MATAQLIGTDNADFKPDDYLRFHSPLTRLFTPLRAHLSFNGQKLVNVDIRNSQVVFFLKLMKEQLLLRWVEQDDRGCEREARQRASLNSIGSSGEGVSSSLLQSKNVEDDQIDQRDKASQFMFYYLQ